MSESLKAITRSVANSLAPSHREIVQAILYSQNHSASALQLKALLNLRSIVQANAAIGSLGRKIYQQLNKHPDGYALGAFQWWSVAATGFRLKNVGFVWSLRSEVAKGLIDAGYSNNGVALPEEIEVSGLPEGSVKRIAVNSYERNPVARARCIAEYGTSCAVCEVELGIVYGPEAEGYIHIHHLVQLSDIGEEYEVDPIADLRPVCPNCHAVIHLSDPPKTIEQTKLLLAPNISFKRTR